MTGADAYPVGSGDPPVARVAHTAEAVTAEAETRDAAIQNAHPTMILWYSYEDILRSEDPTRRWRALTHAAFSISRRG